MSPVSTAMAFMSFSSCASSGGIVACVWSTTYFDWLTASSSPMPESKRDLRMSYVSVCRTRFVRATAMRCCVVLSSMYSRPTSAVSVTHASARLHSAACISASADSVALLLPPKMSISHDASNPPRKRSP